MTYSKGVFYERELFQFLKSRGFSTARIAGSGHNTPADILAIKKGITLCIEVKAHQNKPRIKKDKLVEMKEWCEKSGAMGFLAWRAPQKKWVFLPLKKMELNNYQDEHWLEMESLLAALDVK